MRKILNIGGNDVAFECNAVTPIFYKNEFGKDYMAEMLKLYGAMDVLKDPEKADPKKFDSIDFEIFSRLAWACAKTANKDGTPEYFEWLLENKDFNTFDHGFPVIELVQKNFETKKK